MPNNTQLTKENNIWGKLSSFRPVFIILLILLIVWLLYEAGFLAKKTYYANIAVARGNITLNVKGTGTLQRLLNNELAFNLDVFATDLNKIKVGQDVQITKTGEPEPKQLYYGIINNINSTGVMKDGLKVYPVRVLVTSFEGFKPGLRVNAEILAKKNVLRLPLTAIKDNNLVLIAGENSNSKRAVSKVEAPRGYHYLKIQTGKTDNDYAEILGGLAEGDPVAVASENGPVLKHT